MFMTSSHRSEKNAQFYSVSVAGCLVPLDARYREGSGEGCSTVEFITTWFFWSYQLLPGPTDSYRVRQPGILDFRF